MISDTFNSLKNLDENVWRQMSTKSNLYEKFLDDLFPNWYEFIIQKENDELKFYEESELQFSFRLNLKTGQYEHIDIYLQNEIKPYRRAFLRNNVVIKFRYYEYNSWKRNYDVAIGSNFSPIYTIEYFENKARYIDFYYKPGMLFYNKSEFLNHMGIGKIDEGHSNNDNK